MFGIAIDDDRAAAGPVGGRGQPAPWRAARRRRPPPPPLGLYRRRTGGRGHYARDEGWRGSARCDAAAECHFVECWATCRHADKRDEYNDGDVDTAAEPLADLAPLVISADSDGVHLRGCGLNEIVTSGKRAHYDVFLSLITPYVG